jgi:hypothetical protein
MRRLWRISVVAASTAYPSTQYQSICLPGTALLLPRNHRRPRGILGGGLPRKRRGFATMGGRWSGVTQKRPKVCTSLFHFESSIDVTNRRPIHATRSCCSKLGSGVDTHNHDIPPSRSERTRDQSRLRAPPHPPSRRPTPEQLTEAWDTYQDRCRAMCNRPRVTSLKRRNLSFSSIPWPVFGAVTRLSDLCLPAIQSFLCTPDCDRREQRARVKEALLMFHPDKSVSRWVSHLRPEDVATVKEALNIVTSHLTTIHHSF